MKVAIITDIIIEPVIFWTEAFSGKLFERKKDFEIPDLSEFDLLFIYFIKTGDITLTSEIRKRYPNLKIFLQTDSDFWWSVASWLSTKDVEYKLTDEVAQGLRDASVVLTLNPLSHKWYKRLGINSILDFFITRIPCYIPEIKSYDERIKEKKAVILCHSMPAYKIKSNLEIAKMCGLKPVVIGTYHNNVMLKEMVEQVGFKDYEVYESFGSNTQLYLDKINECIIALEDWYCGGSRFGIECSICGVPVVGSENALSLLILSPEYTCPNEDKECLVKKVNEILNMDKEKYTDLSKKISNNAKSYFSRKVTKERIIELVNKI